MRVRAPLLALTALVAACGDPGDDTGNDRDTSDTEVVSDAPEVSITAPGASGVVPGEVVSVTVSAIAIDGRAITEVLLLADGDAVGLDGEAPYAFEFTVPAGATVGSTIPLQARAEDDAGDTALSAEVVLTVENIAPVATFEVTTGTTRLVEVDASAVTDAETPTAELQVRWDFEDDGTWDTELGTLKTAQHTYAESGTHTVRLEVRDAAGATSSTTRDAVVSPSIHVSGDVFGTWEDTVYVDADATVPANQTLTLLPGTRVVFADDTGLVIVGALDVQGTAERPATFTSDTAEPGSWTGLDLSGTQTLSNAVVEFADDNLTLTTTATLTDVESRSGTRCAVVKTGADVTWTGGSLHHCVAQGLFHEDGTVALSEVQVHDNGDWGIDTDGGTRSFDGVSVFANASGGLYATGTANLDLTRSTISDNRGPGLKMEYYGGTWNAGHWAGQITCNTFTGNDDVGLILQSYYPGTGKVQFNNIYGNAVVGSTGWGDDWSFVEGRELELAAMSWYPSQHYDLRGNYWGAFDDPRNHFSRHLDWSGSPTPPPSVVGFTAGLYDEDCNLETPTYGAEDLTGEVTLSGTVHVTGPIVVAADAVVTVEPGTRIEVFPFDTDSDGTNDLGFDVRGTFDAVGTAEEPITFTSVLVGEATEPAPDDWKSVVFTGQGGSGELRHVVLEGQAADVAITCSDGASFTVAQTTLTSGIHASWCNGVTLEEVVVDGSDSDGILVGSSTDVALSHVEVYDSLGAGLLLSGGENITVEDSTFVGNAHGIDIYGTSPAIDHCHVEDNLDYGVRYRAPAGGTLTACDITANGANGIAVLGGAAGASANPSISGNNVHGNSLTGSGKYHTLDWTAHRYNGLQSADTATYQAPRPIEVLRWAYREEPASNDFPYGAVYRDGIYFVRYSYEPIGPQTEAVDTMSVHASVYSNVASNGTSATTTLSGVYHLDNTPSGIELSYVDDAAVLELGGNYWGTTDDPKVRMSAVDNSHLGVTTFETSAISGTGPR